MTLICVPIVEANVKDAKNAMQKAKDAGADLVELRLDYLGKLDDGKIGDVVDWDGIPKIVTLRSEKEGGFWKGDEKQRINYLLTCLSFGAQYVDIEDSTDIGWRYEIAKACKANKAEMIISHHDFQKTPSRQDLIDICKNEYAGGGTIAKIACMPKNTDDVMNMLYVLEHYKAKGKPIIALSIGRMGRITRMFGPQLGAYLTYACLEKGKESAEGQLTVEELRAVLKMLE